MARVAPAIARLTALPDEERKVGPFLLTRQLGKGGFAPVWLAKEVYGGTEVRMVALKLFALDDGSITGVGGDTTMRKARRDAIFGEARALCQVEHPNIVRFFAIASDETAGVLGLAMECLNGQPLDRKIADAGKLDVHETLAVGCAVASALAAVHANGLVHCDIKPANVIDALGVYKLIDFGIAAGGVTVPGVRRRRRASVTQTAPAAPPSKEPLPLSVLDDLPMTTTPAPRRAGTTGLTTSGTPGYMDPAALRSGAPSTPSSDLYSLGAMLFECLTGQLPAVAAARIAGTGGLKPEVLDGSEHAPPVAAVAGTVPTPIASLVDALLDPDPARRPRSAEIVAWELERIRRDMAGRTRPLPPEELGPFRGLGRFEQTDRDVYFGRSSEVASGLEMVRRRGVVALIGPSGSGKSSLARAGLLPAIVDGELSRWPKDWDSAVVQPGEDPRSAIGSALDPFVEDAAKMEPESLAAALADSVADSGRGVVLLVDQLEELVTLARGPSRAWAVAFLARLGAQALPGVRCIVTARRDLLDELLALDELGRVLTHSTLLVAPLSDAAWEEVLDHALEVYGYSLEDAEMRRVLLDQLKGTTGAMPLVQFALTRLWERRDRERHVVPRAALDAIGGIGGALEAHADATLAKVGGAEALPVVRSVLLALTTAQGTRATRPRKELEARAPGGRASAVITEFLQARLLVSEPEGLAITHDALLVRWGILRQWIAEAREDRMHAEELDREAASWIADQRAPERLLKKRRLLAARDLLARKTTPVGEAAVELVRASERAHRVGRLLSSLPVVLVALGVLVALLVRWDTHRLKVSWCTNLVERRQVVECIHAASPAEIAHRALTARVSTRGGRVQAVDWVNGMGQPALNEDGYARIEYRYDASDHVQEIDDFDRVGNLRLKQIFRDDAQREERLDAFDLPMPLSGTDDVTGERRTGTATVIKYTYDARGFVVTQRFFSKFGDRPRTDQHDAFGYSWVCDDRGQWTSADVLGEDGKPAPTVDGYAHATARYDKRGDRIELSLLDLTGQPAFMKTRVSTTRFEFDQYGNQVATSFYGAGDALTTSVWGYARLTMKYDSHGDVVERWYLDRAGAPTMMHSPSASTAADAYGYAGTVSTYDAKGNEIETTYMGPDRKPVYLPAGYAKLRRVWDARDEVVEFDLLDDGGKLTLDSEGKAIMLQSHDERGNTTDRSFLGLSHEPVMVYGFARHTSRYERDRVVDDSYFALDGHLTAGEGDFARVTHTYDDAGNERDVVYYGPDAAPVLLPDRYAQLRRVWADGVNTETSYFGVDGKPTLVAGNYFLEVNRYNDGGDLLEAAYFATDSRTPTVHWGESRRTLAYNPQGRLVEERLFGTDGAPVLAGSDDDASPLRGNGYARRVLSYDARGNIADERFFGVDGAPILRRDIRVSRRAFRYDDRGNKIEEAYFATDGVTPTRSTEGIAGWRARYDADSREVWKEYFDVDGKPTYSSRGYASYTVAYDAAGHETERKFSGVDGQPALAKLDDEGFAARITRTYDLRGDLLETAYFGLDGAPTPHLGFAHRLRKVDERGREIEDACTGVDGHAVLCPEGYARRTRTLDARGKETLVAFFDAEGQPLADKRGVAVEKDTYDALGHLTEERFEGPEGKLVAPSSMGYARLTASFDAVGHEIARAYFGADDAPTAKDGAARVETAYDQGKPVDVRRFGPDGNPVAPTVGYAHLVRQFDGGHEVHRALFDASGAPFQDPERWSSWKASYDPGGNETARAYFDREGKPVVTTRGFARTAARYDEASHPVEREWFDANDKPIAVEGVAREVVRYDEWGKESEHAYFGADGNPVKKDGVARVKTSRDRQGRIIEVAYYGPDNKLARRLPTSDNDVAYARVTYQLDTRGNYSEVAYYGVDGQPMMSQHGYARWELSWNDHNYETDESYFDTHGKPAKEENGAYAIHDDYDAWGNLVKRTLLDDAGKPTLSKQGIAGWESRWDTQGHETRRSLFGKNGEPVSGLPEKWSSWTSTYDVQGHPTAHAYFGVDGKPFVLPANGWASWTKTYDAYGNMTSDAAFGADGKPVAVKGEKYARVEWKYQGVELETEQSYYDPDGKPAPGPAGWATERTTYDASGRERSRSYVGADGKPWAVTVLKPTGWARREREYDMRGRIALHRYFDRDDRPLARCVTEKLVYDESSEKASKHVCSDARGAVTVSW